MRAEGKAQRPSLLTVPGQSKPSGSGLNPCFLWDNMEYLLGFTVDPAKAARAPRAFEAFRQAHFAREEAIAHPAFSAVCTFLRSWSVEQVQSHREELTPLATHFGVFRLAGERQYVHELVTVPDSVEETTLAEELATCLVSGEMSRTARLHEPKIKGVAGAQTSGALLVSFNSPALSNSPLLAASIPIVPAEFTITRCAVTNDRDLEKERTIGRKFTVPYGLYRCYGFLNASSSPH